MRRQQPRSTSTDTLFPYTTVVRSWMTGATSSRGSETGCQVRVGDSGNLRGSAAEVPQSWFPWWSLTRRATHRESSARAGLLGSFIQFEGSPLLVTPSFLCVIFDRDAP